MARKTLIEPTPGAGFTQEVAESALTNKQAGPVAYFRPVPFAFSAGKGTVNRKQGISRASSVTHEQFLHCVMDRDKNDTLAGLKLKGDTVFMVNQGQDIINQSDYAPGHAWLSYGNAGTNDYDRNPGKTLLDTLDAIHSTLQAVIPARGNELRYFVANFETYEFTDSGQGDPTLARWDLVQVSKSQSFYSPYSNQNETLQGLYNSGGISLLNLHLHAKRTQINFLWLKIVKQKNPNCLVTNGDFMPFIKLHINGDVQLSTGLKNIKDYRSFTDAELFEWMRQGFSGFNQVRGGTQTLGGRTYNFTGYEADHYDFFSQYYYYSGVYCKQSDYNDLMSTNDPAKLTVDAWHGKFFFHRDELYLLAASWEVRQYVFTRYAAAGNKDFRQLRQFTMFEDMYEVRFTRIVADNSTETNANVLSYESAAAPNMRWITINSQMLLIHEELVRNREGGAAILMDGVLKWWEEQGPISYQVGPNNQPWKYSQFHNRVNEFIQKKRDEMRQDEDIWVPGPDKVRTIEGIPMRWKKNGGTFTDWYNSKSPALTLYGGKSGGNTVYEPCIIAAERPGKVDYMLWNGQERTDVTTVEFKRNGVTHTAIIKGCFDTTLTIRDNLPTT